MKGVVVAGIAPRDPASASTARFGELEIDFGARRVLLGGAAVELTRSEFALLEVLARHPDRAISDRDLLGAMWGRPWQGDTSALQVHVSRLRHKLGEAGSRQRYVRTVHGFGYRFDPTPPPAAPLALSDTELAALEDSVPTGDTVAYLLTNGDRMVQWVSDSVHDLLGWHPEDLVGVSLYDLASPLQREEWAAAREPLDAGQPLVTTGLVRAADGSYLTTEATVRPLLGSDGRLSGLLAEWRRAPAAPSEGPPAPLRPISLDASSDVSLLEMLLESSDVFFVFDAEGVCRWVSPSVEPLLGHEPAALVGTRPQLVHPDDRDAMAQQLRAAVRAGERGLRRRVRLVTADGRVRRVDWSMTLQWRDGRLVRSLSSVRDVEAEVAAQDALVTSRATYRLLADHSVDVVVVTDAAGLLTYVAPAITAVLGWEPAELVGTPIRDLVHADDVPAVAAAAQRMAAVGGARRVRARLRRRDGGYRWMESAGRYLEDAAGTPVGGVASWRDIDAEMAAHAALAASEERYRTLVAAVPTGIVVHAADGAIVSCNRAAEDILGLTRDQLMGRSSVDPRWRAVHEDGRDFPGEDHPAMVTLRTGVPVDGELMGVPAPDGTLRWISVTTRPFTRPEAPGEPAVLATFTDVTSLRTTADPSA